MLEQGYAELCNVYMFTAPLDAANFKRIKGAKYADVAFNQDCWARVVAMNMVAEDTMHLDYLKAYKLVQERRERKAIERDPFPTEDMSVVAGLLKMAR